MELATGETLMGKPDFPISDLPLLLKHGAKVPLHNTSTAPLKAPKRTREPLCAEPVGWSGTDNRSWYMVLPVRTENAANKREHWSAHQPLKHAQDLLIGVALRGCTLKLPLTVTFTRIAAKQMDTDGLANSCKRLRDCVARHVGVDDGDSRWTWVYEQARCVGEGLVVVRIEQV
jgi:hypothetical protein